MNSFRRTALTLAAATLLAGTAAAEIAPGTVQLRGRIISISPNDDSGHVTGIPDSGVEVDDAITGEFDVTIFFGQHVAMEIIAATTSHDISGTGSIAPLHRIADTGVLPPTITFQGHFRPEQKFRPYVGAGINYTFFYDEDVSKSLEDALVPTEISLDDSFGWAAQAGFDVAINDHWFFNFDLKYIDIDTEAVLVSDDGVNVTRRTVDVDINPWVPGFGFGYRFGQ